MKVSLAWLGVQYMDLMESHGICFGATGLALSASHNFYIIRLFYLISLQAMSSILFGV